MRIVHAFLLTLAVTLLAVCAGCGGEERKSEKLGEASLERKSAFAAAVAQACMRFDGLGGDDVKFEITTNASRCALTVNWAKIDRRALQRALSVALTNLSLEYPGLGFMRNDDGTWQILMPDDILIPVTGGFGLDAK